MSNETLRVRVGRISNVLFMQVAGMPEQFRNNFEFMANSGTTIYSEDGPNLALEYDAAVFLQGTERGDDNDVVTETFDVAEEAARCYAQLVEALQEASFEMERIMNEEPKETPGPQADGITFDESDVI